MMYSFSVSSRALLFFSISTSLLKVVETTNPATCFFPDQTVAKNYVACSSTQNGGCCQESDICTNWGYCVSQSRGYHYRGACTDSTWGNPSCPDYCLGSSTGNNSFVNVIACNVADSDGTWCCAYDGNCCSGSSTFVAGFGTMFAEPGGSLTTSAVVSGSTLVSASATSPSSPPISQTSLGSVTASTSSSSATNTSVSSSSTSTTPTIVGAAVGIPLALAAIASLFLFYRERRKRTNSQASGFGTKKLDDSGGFSPGDNMVPQNAPPAAGYYAPNDPIKSFGELGVRDPHYELGPGARPFELEDREV